MQSQSVKTPEWLGEVNTRPLVLKDFLLFFAGIAFNIYTKEIICHLVRALQVVLSSGSLKNMFLGNGNQQSFEIYPHEYAVLLQLY